MQKTTLFTLAFLAVPALAVASPEIAVHQTPAKPVPTITIHAPSLLRTRIIANRFRVVWPLPTYVVLESVSGPPVRLTLQASARTAMALHQGEIVKLQIAPVRGRP
jgi:hypothetical protein